MPTPTCTFCDRPAISGGYIQPPMCNEHHTLAVMVSLLKNYNLPINLENLNRLASGMYPRVKLLPDAIPDLARPMLEERIAS